MSIEHTQAQSQVSDPFSYLYPHEFIRLTTFRKNGVAVSTAVWFANDNGKLYVTTTSTAGKIQRIRNSGRVLVAPCDRTGQVLAGKEIEAQAHELSVEEHEHAFATLSKKYGPQFVTIASRAPETTQRTYFVIEPLQEQ
ncbi:MAG: PPOX class F420-dependent oxidoreductase [Ktedonobacteraceae bacterium]